MQEAVALVETDGAGVVGVDQERDLAGRELLCPVEQGGGQHGAPVIGSDHELVEVARGIDGHKSDQGIFLFGEQDAGVRHQFMAPALTPPADPRGKIDGGIGLLPGFQPQGDRRVFILGAIGAKLEGEAHGFVMTALVVNAMRLAKSRAGSCEWRFWRRVRHAPSR